MGKFIFVLDMTFSNCFSMTLKRWFMVWISFVISMGGGWVFAQQPDGDAILEMVRYSQAMQELPKLTGKLRNDIPDDGRKHLFELTMANGKMRFAFKNPDEVIEMELAEAGTNLGYGTGNAIKPVAESAYGTQVRSTSVNFEDLSLRFLYWPGAKVMGEQTVNTMNCWVVRVVNPDKRGPYHTVDVWIHKDSGAIAKMEAYDRSAKKVKSFRVSKGQRYQKAWILKQMQVESHDPETGRVNGRTYLDIDDPGK